MWGQENIGSTVSTSIDLEEWAGERFLIFHFFKTYLIGTFIVVITIYIYDN